MIKTIEQIRKGAEQESINGVMNRAYEESKYKKVIPRMLKEKTIKEGNRELSKEFNFPWYYG